MAMASNASLLLEKAKSVSEPQYLQDMVEFRSAYVPTESERQLEFLDFNDEGHMLLGCSNLTGRYWVGSLWYYQDPTEAPSVEKALTGLDCDNGVVEGFFVGPRGKDILVALDNGSIELLTLSHNNEDAKKPYNFLERQKTIREHDDIITGMTLSADGSKVVTSSYDKSIVTLDQNSLAVDQRRLDAHSDLVSHVSSNQQNTNVIATCGNDGRVLTWDIRNLSNSSGCVYDDPSVWPTCLAWTPNSEHHLVVGNQSGAIEVFDVRRPNEPVVCDKSISKQIYRMKFSPKRSNLFSVSIDNVSLHVFDLDPDFSSLTVKYCDKRHDDFIRGLAWHPQTDALFTCGWDHKVLSHSF